MPPSTIDRGWTSRRSEEAAQHELKNAAVLIVVDLVGRIDSADDFETLRLAVDARGFDVELFARREAVLHARDVDRLEAGEAERLRVLACHELEREHAHADEVRAMDALEALRDHRAHAEELGP